MRPASAQSSQIDQSRGAASPQATCRPLATAGGEVWLNDRARGAFVAQETANVAHRRAGNGELPVENGGHAPPPGDAPYQQVSSVGNRRGRGAPCFPELPVATPTTRLKHECGHANQPVCAAAGSPTRGTNRQSAASDPHLQQWRGDGRPRSQPSDPGRWRARSPPEFGSRRKRSFAPPPPYRRCESAHGWMPSHVAQQGKGRKILEATRAPHGSLPAPIFASRGSSRLPSGIAMHRARRWSTIARAWNRDRSLKLALRVTGERLNSTTEQCGNAVRTIFAPGFAARLA